MIDLGQLLVRELLPKDREWAKPPWEEADTVASRDAAQSLHDRRRQCCGFTPYLDFFGEFDAVLCMALSARATF